MALIDYSNDRLTVPPSYGVARCLCGGFLSFLFICEDCHAQYSKDDAIYHVLGD